MLRRAPAAGRGDGGRCRREADLDVKAAARATVDVQCGMGRLDDGQAQAEALVAGEPGG